MVLNYLIIYIIIIMIFVTIKPSVMFSEKRLRKFGIGEKETLVPFSLVTIALAIFISATGSVFQISKC